MSKSLLKRQIEKVLEKLEKTRDEIDSIQMGVLDAISELEDKDSLTENQEEYLDWLNELDEEIDDAVTNIDSIELDKFID